MPLSVSTAPKRALVVEDDPHIRELVALHLGLDGWRVTTTGDGLEAVRLSAGDTFDLVVLDVMLPGIDGLTVLAALRRQPAHADVPVLMLTARAEENDRVLGLESGADDYLTKPFGVRELVARTRALSRRPRANAAAPSHEPSMRPLALHGLLIDPSRRRVTSEGRPIDLTGREFELLYLLASHPGIVYTREALVGRVWKGDTHVTARNVDTLIKRLRQKVEREPAAPRVLLTVWGAGYKVADV